MAGMNINSRMAEILNLLFGTHLTGYDLDLAIGRKSVRLKQIGQRLFASECWHNPQWEFSGMMQELSNLLSQSDEEVPESSGWMEIGVRMAVLFGVFGELIREGYASPDKPVDISLVSGNFSAPMAAWYARGMGLPIGNIVCCCNENGVLWDFICHGQLRTDGIARRTQLLEADILVPDGLEQLIALYAGPEEASRYVDCIRQGNTYYVEENLLGRMRKGIYVTVSSERRILSTISSSFSAYGYLLAATSALAHAGLQDYRARTGTSRTAVILTDKSPRQDLTMISEVTGLPEQNLERYL